MQIALKSAGMSGATSAGVGGSQILLRRSTSGTGPANGMVPVSAS